jgi:hypothetical protein
MTGGGRQESGCPSRGRVGFGRKAGFAADEFLQFVLLTDL